MQHSNRTPCNSIRNQSRITKRRGYQTNQNQNLWKGPMLYRHLQRHNDTIIKQTNEDFFTNICTSHFICKGSKRVTRGFRVRGSWRPNRNYNILTSTLMAVSVVSFSFSWCSTGGPAAHSAVWWFSLLHLISNFSGSQLIRAPRPLRPDVAFPTTTRL